MEPIVLPPGYVFVPTDKDLILDYLLPFLQGKQNSFPNVPIHRVNIYESNPEQLSKEFKRGDAITWFFITERTKKSEGGTEQIRSDNGGYWRPTQGDEEIGSGHGVICYKTRLEYYIGKEPNVVKPDWLMHEYWFESDDKRLVDHALCKIYLTPKGIKTKAEEVEIDLNVAYQPPKHQSELYQLLDDLDELEDIVRLGLKKNILH